MEGQTYKVYKYRWVVLLMYIIIAAIIQLLWATFFSITTAAWHYYGFSNAVEGEGAISLLSLVFMIGMIVLSFPSLALFEKFGFKKSVGFGAVLAGSAGLIRGFFGDSYTIVLITTVGFAIAQPFILNAVGMVAGKWFPSNERATANGLGVLSNYVGMMIGLLVTPIMLESGMNIKGILMAYGITAAVAAILFVTLAKEKPPTPPCLPEQVERSKFLEGVKAAFKKKSFILCTICFFCLLGTFNTFLTMIEPILKKLSGGALNATDAGILGVIVLGVGILGSFIIPLLSDKDKKHRRLPYIIVSDIIGLIGFACFMVFGNFSGMAVSAALYGFFVIGSSPVLMTYCAEIAYPTSEGTSEGLLMFAGNVGGVIFLGGAGLFQGNHLISMLVMTAIILVCIVLLFTMKEVPAILQKPCNGKLSEQG